MNRLPYFVLFFLVVCPAALIYRPVARLLGGGNGDGTKSSFRAVKKSNAMVFRKR